MRVLLDENLPHDLTELLVGLDVMTVQGVGWAGVKNGELLRRASGQVDAFVTMDRNLRHQQNLAALPFGVVLIAAPSNRIQDILPLIGALVAALAKIRPGQLEHVGA